jgi:hypothetical protein
MKKIIDVKTPFYQRIATCHGSGHTKAYFLGSRAAAFSDIAHIQIAPIEQGYVFGAKFQYV